MAGTVLPSHYFWWSRQVICLVVTHIPTRYLSWFLSKGSFFWSSSLTSSLSVEECQGSFLWLLWQLHVRPGCTCGLLCLVFISWQAQWNPVLADMLPLYFRCPEEWQSRYRNLEEQSVAFVGKFEHPFPFFSLLFYIRCIPSEYYLTSNTFKGSSSLETTNATSQ